MYNTAEAETKKGGTGQLPRKEPSQRGMSTLCQELRQVLYKRMRDVREGHIRWLAEGRRPALTLGVSQLLCRCQKGRNANRNDTKTQSNGTGVMTMNGL